jgi:hypothetical protein
VQNATLWRALPGIEKAVIADIEFDEDAQLSWLTFVLGSGCGAGAGCADEVTGL